VDVVTRLLPGFPRNTQHGRFAGTDITDNDRKIARLRHMRESRMLFF
jgi:hypothetical protein